MMDTYELQILDKSIALINKSLEMLSEIVGRHFAREKLKDGAGSESTIKIIEEVAPMAKYSDGCFRMHGKKLQYRFMYNGKQITVSGFNKQDCWNKRTDIISGKTIINTKTKSYTLYDWLIEWFKLYAIKKNNDKSQKEKLNYINNYIKPELGNIIIKNLDSLKLQKFINKYDDRPNTQDKIYKILNPALNKAVSTKLIKFNPMSAVEKVNYKKQSYRALEISEQDLIYKNIDNPKYKRLFFFLCCTGIRINRALELDCKAFDKERMIINVFKKQRKGYNEYYQVPFTFDLIDLPQNGKIFPDITYNSAKLYFQKLFKKLNIKNAVLYSFRHTFASTCYFAGIKDKYIQSWMGHNDITTTLNIYTHLLNKGNSKILEYIKGLKRLLA